VVETAGGGGYGEAREREPELVERDRREEYVA
jgi:N-methylhydantoinase B/oxoprolinase/acetone carboxylase alpha subunit